MLKQLQIKSLQSHKNTTLDLHENLNIIIGNSDCGKTSILRALRWAIWNRPGGDTFERNFRSWFGGDTEVTITTEEGNVITRAKNQENLYQLNKTKFKAFGTDIPQEIADALNIQEINFARQFDQPFLLTSTPGEVSSHFNKIAHLELIDASLKKVQSWINGLNQDIKTNEKDILKNQQELEQYAYLEKMEIELEVLEGMERDLQTHYNIQSKLIKLTNEIQTVESDIKETSQILVLEESVVSILFDWDLKESVLKDLNALGISISTYEEISDRIALKQAVIGLEADTDKLLKDIERLEDLEVGVDAISTTCDKIQSIEKQIAEKNKLLELETLIQYMLEFYEQLEETNKQRKELNVLLERIRGIEVHINVETKLHIPKLQAQFEKEMGEECILCGQVIEHKH